MEQLWWERVPSATAFTSDVVQSLLDEKSILLQSDSGIPWRDYWVDLVHEQVRQNDFSKRFETVVCDSLPGLYLLNTFCKEEKRAQYRPSKTYARFLAESDDIVLHSRYLWVVVETEDMLKEWVSFVSEYVTARDKSKETAVFILEWHGSAQNGAKRGVKNVDFDSYINEYDRIVFATLAASTVQEPPAIKHYLTELAANLLGNDVELCAECMDSYRNFLNEPYQTIRDIVDDTLRSDRTAFDFPLSQHATEHMMWQAQIRAIYPIIEEYRLHFVQRYEKEIRKELPLVSAYGEQYDEPEDVELAALKYMAGHGGLHLDWNTFEELRSFWSARNKLSHLQLLEMTEIDKLCR